MPGPSANTAGFSALLSGQHRLLTVHTSSGRRGQGAGVAHAGGGAGLGGAGHFLGFSPEGSPQRGARGKSPRLSRDSL